MPKLERYRPTMSADVLHSWSADAQVEIDLLRDILRRVNADLIPHLRDTGHNAVDREMSETISAVRGAI